MKLKDYLGWILMLAAVGVGALSFFLIRQYLATQEQQFRLDVMRDRGQTEKVIVAKRSLEPGAVIRQDTMAIGEVPRQHLPGRAVLPADFTRVENRVLSRPMSAGEPLLADFVSGLLIDRFSDLLGPGERAFSLEVSALETHSGMLVPGDYIDLFALVPMENGGKGEKDKRLLPVLERVKVLAAGPEPLRAAEQSFQPLPDKESHYSQITVGVPLEDAERLLLAREIGEVVYLLRNARDDQLEMSGTQRSFFGQNEGGYLYYSVGVPEGKRRNAERTPLVASQSDPSAGFGGAETPEAATESADEVHE